MKLTCGLAATALTAMLTFPAFAGEDFTINISPSANRDFKSAAAGDGKGWSDQGPDNDLHGFDVKRSDFGGMRFSIVDPAKNNGKAVIRVGLPKGKASTFDLSRQLPRARYIYLLHSSCFNHETPGTAIGALEVLFADGSSWKKEIKTGIDIADWYNPGSIKNALLVHKETNKAGVTFGAFLSKFEFEDGERAVKAVSFTSNSKAMWMVIGATLSSRNIEIERKVVFNANKEWKTADMSHVRLKPGSALDLSGIFEEGPAGRHGRVIVSARPDCLAFEDSPQKPQRFFGYGAFFQTFKRILNTSDKELLKKQIAEYAALSKRHGYNLIRPLASDGYLMKDKSAAAGTELAPGKLDNFDRIIAEMKANGIYTILTLSAYRMASAAPGGWSIDYGKLEMLLGEQSARSRWKTLAEKQLAHVNPYTGIAWKDDPAIAFVELYNEQGGAIKYTSVLLKNISPETRELFKSRWRDWLLRKYRTPSGLAAAWNKPVSALGAALETLDIPTDSELNKADGINPDANDFGLFVRDLGREQYLWCRDVVRGAGYNGLITYLDCYRSLLDSQTRWEEMDIVTMHGYHSHPRGSLNFGPGTMVSQESSAGSAFWHWKDNINSTRLTDRPFLVTEHSHYFWNQYQHEDGLLFSSYSALQGFAGSVSQEDPVALEEIKDAYDAPNWYAYNPVQKANEFIGACIFGRGDVSQASHKVELQIPLNYLNVNGNGGKAVNTEQNKIALMTRFGIAFPGIKRPESIAANKISAPEIVIPAGRGAEIKAGQMDSTVEQSGNNTFSMADFVKKMRMQGILPADNISDPDAGVFQSETGEITLRTKENLVKVITPRTVGVSIEADKPETAGCLTIAGSSIPAAIVICSVDGRPVTESTRMVLVYNTEMAFSGMELSEDRVTMISRGKMPVLLRAGRLEAALKCKNAAKLALYMLRMDGSRAMKIPVTAESGTLKIMIDTANIMDSITPFFELVTE